MLLPRPRARAESSWAQHGGRKSGGSSTHSTSGVRRVPRERTRQDKTRADSAHSACVWNSPRSYRTTSAAAAFTRTANTTTHRKLNRIAHARTKTHHHTKPHHRPHRPPRGAPSASRLPRRTHACTRRRRHCAWRTGRVTYVCTERQSALYGNPFAHLFSRAPPLHKCATECAK